MPRRPKGFDPLASLFLKPSTDLSASEEEDDPLEEEDSSQLSIFPVLELTDPMFAGPMGHSRPPSTSILRGRDDPPPYRRLEMPTTVTTDPALLDVPESHFFPAGLPAQPEPTTETTAMENPETEGAAVSNNIAAPAGGVELLPGVEDVAPQDDSPQAAPQAVTEPARADPVALARALARAAVAQAGPPRPAPNRTRARTSHAVSPPSENNQLPGNQPSKKQLSPESPSDTRPLSRAERLSMRAVRVRSADAYIRSAERVEQEETEHAQQRRQAVAAQQDQQAPPPPADEPSAFVVEVQELLQQKLRGLGPIVVANCVAVDDRNTLKAVWRAHRAHFAAAGELERVVGAEAVLHALDSIPEGQLVAAHVHTEASDYMVWLDLRHGSSLAAFANARAYFVGR